MEEDATARPAVDLGIPGLTDAVEVARGGFSTIYRATQTTMERTVAVKVIHATVVDPVAGEHFLREVRATGRLSQHPNVAPVYDVGTAASGQPYLLMPYYEHGSLQHRLSAGGALSEAQAVRMARTLATTLEYVHQRNVVHRDIKPANVLLSQDDEPLLADFGVARLMDASVPMHTTGANVVTWAYGPPEAFTGGLPTPAWDIYSLGATVYAMLTGQPPFVDGEDVNVFTVLNRIGNVDIPDLRDRGVSPAVADAVRRAMAKDPADRPASAAEVAALLAPAPARAPAPSPEVERVAPEPVAIVEAVAVVESPRSPEAPETPQAEHGSEPVEVAPVVAEPETEPEPSARAVAEPESQPEPSARAVAEPESQPEPSAPVVGVVAAAEPPAPVSSPPARSRRRSRPGRANVVTVLAAAVVLLDIAAIRTSYFVDYGYLLDAGFLRDVDVWMGPVAIVVGLVFARLRPGVGHEWLIGAATAFLMLDVFPFVSYLDEQGDTLNDAFGILRTLATLLALLVIVLSWRLAQTPGPRISGLLVVLFVLGAGLAFYGTQQYGSESGYGWLEWMVLVLVVVLALRAFAYPSRTTGAPALAVAGVIGVVDALATGNLNGWSGWVATFAVGFALIAAVGVVRWRQSSATDLVGEPRAP